MHACDESCACSFFFDFFLLPRDFNFMYVVMIVVVFFVVVFVNLLPTNRSNLKSPRLGFVFFFDFAFFLYVFFCLVFFFFEARLYCILQLNGMYGNFFFVR